MKESKALSFAAQLKCELNKKLQGDQRQLQFPTVISRLASHTPLSLVLLGCAGQLASKAEAAASTCQIFSKPFIDLPHTQKTAYHRFTQTFSWTSSLAPTPFFGA